MRDSPSAYRAGRHFLQIPGPTNVPDRILRAMDRPTIDHRGPEFSHLARECLEGMKNIFQMSTGQVFIYPASGTGAWEAAIVNTLSPGDHVLMFETGQFAVLWRKIAERFGLVVDFVEKVVAARSIDAPMRIERLSRGEDLFRDDVQRPR